MADLIISERRLIYVDEMKCYVVNAFDGRNYAVTTQPKEDCRCVSSSMCYHIIACRIYEGNYEERRPCNVNLSLLKRKSRTRHDKLSGRKNPRPNDIQPAPDSPNTKRPQGK